jgi:hypothetical protein
MENLIKLHKTQLSSDRMSCHSATANQVRLVLHTAAFWLMHGVRAAIPQTSPLATAEFATIRERYRCERGALCDGAQTAEGRPLATLDLGGDQPRAEHGADHSRKGRRQRPHEQGPSGTD